MRLSVILIGYNSWHFLEKCLTSLSFVHSYQGDVEVIYVDNGSKDGSFHQVQNRYPWVQLIQNDRNQGVSAARNQGIKKAVGNYILLLDSDTEISSSALEEMFAFMELHPEAGLCGCKMYGPDGSINDSCRPFPSIGKKLTAGFRILANKLHCPVKETHDYDKNAGEPFEVDYVVGACQMIRKEAQQQIGLLDEHIFYGPEDADFCLRMKQAGYKVYYLPQTVIYHAYQRLSSQRVFSKLNWKHLQGLLYYFWKHSKYREKN